MSSSTLTYDAALDAGAPQVVHARWKRVALALALIELVLVYAPTLKWLWGRWTLSVWHNAHGAMIPPVVAYLAWSELRARRGLPRSASAWGFLLLVPALALHALDAGMHTELLSAVSILAVLPGLALLLLGTERTRAILFPLAFLAFALPIPLGMTERIHWYLRIMVTAATSHIVPLFGVPLYSQDTAIFVPNGSMEIADACSGFSTLYAAAAVAVLTAYMTPSIRRRIVVLLAAAPLAIASNILRVSALVLLVEWRGPEVLETFIHPLSGMLTFALALPVIFWLGGDPAPRPAAPQEVRA